MYYHVTSPEIAKQIVENQVIPANNFGNAGAVWGELPWVKDAIARKKQLPHSSYIQSLRSEREKRGWEYKNALHKLSPKMNVILFWKDLQEARAWYHNAKFNAQMEEWNDITKAAILKCEIAVNLIVWPRDIIVHTPTERQPTVPRQSTYHVFPATFSDAGKQISRRKIDRKLRFNTEVLTSAYYYPTDKEDIPGKFEVIT